MKVKSEREVAQSCLTLRDLMDCSPPGSSIHGIFQARVNIYTLPYVKQSKLLCSTGNYTQYFLITYKGNESGNNTQTYICTHVYVCPTPVFLPGESQGWGSLVGFRLWGHTESDTTEAT